MGNTNDVTISVPDLEVDETGEVDVATIWTDYMIYSCQNIGGMCELVEMLRYSSDMKMSYIWECLC